ncbi:CKLF-like MARVEL transmembrane domain-containing protein 6 [Sinocyclocheilus anshuiensis]|uniref:CKLF-like MARVEL transmembrane domain-containing protein 6 n=1 Tax=Sinocyclocheilus anshuiensis TaxID=1608454 RepID=A0A671Q3S6_9TELE|nr:PREDICTED: CKLF-like MARVEL transmembrane domain-containing protein 6 [Sinocyclocheilus anshuiensis]
MATTDTVYNTTTTVQEPKSKKWIIVPSENLDKIRYVIKGIEVLLSFVAFVMEEVVSNCLHCGPLYFFEFVSCSAFLFTLLLLILLATVLHQRVGINCWPTLDFGYTTGMAILFLLASIVFASDNGQTDLEQGAVAFGFLATVAFFMDFGLFVKNHGIPCRKGNNQQADGTPRPESEKLNSNGTDSVN